MSRLKQRRILAIVATDNTFSRRVVGGEEAWVGKCIHCNRRLVIAISGAPMGDATIEHIVPRNHDGSNEVENLALACARCNTEKGLRHDLRRASDPKLAEIVERLQQRRRERWREPADG